MNGNSADINNDRHFNLGCVWVEVAESDHRTIRTASSLLKGEESFVESAGEGDAGSEPVIGECRAWGFKFRHIPARASGYLSILE